MTDNSEHADGQSALFADFDVPTYDEWVAVALASLRGRPLEKISGQTYEGISLRPLYHQGDLAGLPHLETLPGQFPYLRGTRADGYLAAPWLIAQEIAAPTPALFNAALRHDLAHGQTAVNLIPDMPTRDGLDPDQAPPGAVGRDGVSLADLADLAAALDGVDLATTPLFLRAGAAVLPLAALLAAFAARSGQDLGALRGGLEADPLGELARRGRLPLSPAEAYDELAQVVRWAQAAAPHLHVITVHGYPYANAGGSAVQELGFVLATAVEYLRALQTRGLDVDTAATRMQFAFTLGGDFFMEIARLRAARLLWAQIVQAFGGSETAQKMVIHGRSARWNKTVTDPYVNMLRVTTEALAGAVGGVDSLHADPFDAEARPPDDFARRIARNAQVILQEEANLKQIIDPAGGSYFVEWLTDQVAQRAWVLFQEVEAQGGMLAALQAGLPQQQVAATAAARAHNLARRKDVLVGVNLYANVDEQPLAPDKTDYAAVQAERATAVAGRRRPEAALGLDGAPPAMATAIAAAAAGATVGQLTAALRRGYAKDGGTAVTPLAQQRGAEPFEQLRAKAAAYAAQHGHPPRVFLANMGPLRQHKARADFARAFFEVGGFEVVYPQGFETPAAAVRAAVEAGVTAVVICSTDETYPDLVPPLVSSLKARRPDAVVILAGYPKDQVAAHKAAGVDEFIYLGADCLALNQWLQSRIMGRG
jgi:methylmalonyl-CoA mutase